MRIHAIEEEKKLMDAIEPYWEWIPGKPPGLKEGTPEDIKRMHEELLRKSREREEQFLELEI